MDQFPEQIEVIVESDVEDIREWTVACVESAVMFLRASGVDPGQSFRVRHIQGPCFVSEHIAARANLVFSREETIQNQVELQARAFKDSFGIILSEEALAEFKVLMEKEFDKVLGKLKDEFKEEDLEGKEADILIYGEEYPEDLMPVIGVFVHEIWHLIEQRYGVFNLGELIHEATATYVQSIFLNDHNRPEFESPNEASEILYKRGAQIVREELAKKSSPRDFSLILNPGFRAVLIERFDKEILPAYFEASGKTIGDFERNQVLNDPAYKDFIENPSKENLLKALRLKGLNYRARDFEAQDITKYLNYMRLLVEKNEEE